MSQHTLHTLRPGEPEPAPSSAVGLGAKLDAMSAGELLELVARGGEELDPDLTPAGDYLRWL